jgi:hypothetical protein
LPAIIADREREFERGEASTSSTLSLKGSEAQAMATIITERLSGTPAAAGSPTDLAAIEDLSGTGIPERTAANAWVLHPISGAGNAWSPEIAGSLSLGTGGLPWSDLFLAVGGIVNWGEGDVTLTHAANTLSFAGAADGYAFDGSLKLSSGGAIDFAGGDVTVTHASNALAFAGASEGHSFDVAPNVGGSTVALLSTENQSLAGGADVTVKDLGTQSSGTLTLDMGDRPLQKCVNGGSFTVAPGTVKGACLLTITNSGSAGTITTSGWTQIAGDSFTTTNTEKFLCHCVVDDDGDSVLIVQAYQ